ncbi:hypothetical protein Hanom_Chr01g00024851 [Helianthus anomalus]
MAGMSLLWRDIKLYPSFRRDDEGEWTLFDFVDPPRHAALKAADRVIGEQEPDVLKIHMEHFLLPSVSADPAVYISQPPPSGGSNVVATEKILTRIRVTGRKYMAAGAASSSVGVTTPAGSAVVTVAELTSPTHISKKTQNFYCTGSDCFRGYASRLRPANCVTTAVSCTMPPPMPTTAVTVTTSPVSTPLPSSVTPSSLFDSHLGNVSVTEKKMPTVSAAHEATSVMDAAMSDAGGSSNGIADDGARLGDDLYLPTINWDPNMQDKRY